MRFNQFDKLNEEEGWKTNVLVGLLSLLGVQAMGHKVKDERHLTTHTHLQSTVQSYLKQGWSLDSTQVDTIYAKVKAEKPDTIVSVARLKLDKDQYFDSGKFGLSQEVKDSISQTLNSINGVVIDIVITSSTDKQGLSINLQNQLKSLGYSADNIGLSKARAAGLEKYLTTLGVSDSLIRVQTQFEQGSGTIDQSARFVSVDIYFLQITETIKPGEKIVPKVNKTFYLSKDVNYKHKHIRGGGPIMKMLGPLSKIKRGYSCPAYD
jgi:outer membrane protein OmpA-like peptidoglycan-associated protein